MTSISTSFNVSLYKTEPPASSQCFPGNSASLDDGTLETLTMLLPRQSRVKSQMMPPSKRAAQSAEKMIEGLLIFTTVLHSWGMLFLMPSK